MKKFIWATAKRPQGSGAWSRPVCDREAELLEEVAVG